MGVFSSCGKRVNEGSWGFPFVYLFIIEEWFIYNVVLITAVEQSDSVMHTHTHTHIFFFILFHYGFTIGY